MLRTILKKELHDHLISFRFILSFILIVGLMGVGTILFIQDYSNQLTKYSRLKSQAWEAKKFNIIYIHKKPTVMNLVAEGRERYLPKEFMISSDPMVNYVDAVSDIKANRTFVRGFFNLDWVYIVGVLMSLVAIVFAFDALCGEKEAGTLGLIYSNPVSRSSIIIGKFISIIICIGLSLLIGILISLIISLASPEIRFSTSQWLGIASVTIVALIYLSLFTLLGILISSLTAKSSYSLVILLTLWTLLVIIVPNSGSLLAGIFHPIPTEIEYEKQREARRQEYYRVYYDGDDWVNEEVNKLLKSGGSTNAIQSRLAEIQQRVQKLRDGAKFSWWDWLSKQLKEKNRRREAQTQFARKITVFSPYVLFQIVSEALAGTGYFRYENFLRQAEAYLHTFRTYSNTLQEKYQEQARPRYTPYKGGVRYLKLYDYRRVTFDFSDYPRFVEEEIPFDERLSRAIFPFSILILMSTLIFAGAWVGFLRYDVR